MCSNQVLIDSVECYMDDLVERFEDYVKKSLIVISLGVGIIVVMLAYLLRVVGDRSPTSNIIVEDAAGAHNQIRNIALRDNIKKEDVVNNMTLPRKHFRESDLPKDNDELKITTGVNTVSGLAPVASFDNQVLRDVGLSLCSKPGYCDRSNCDIVCTPCRIPVPSVALSKRKSGHTIQSSKHCTLPSLMYSKNASKLGSCCSICRNNE